MAHSLRITVYLILACLMLCAGPTAVRTPARAEHRGTGADRVLKDEAERIAMIERVSPSVVSVLDSNKRGGGSGVVIDPEGYGLTNYHVIAGSLARGRGWGGLSDGKTYEMEILGVDPTGDVAMFRLIGDGPFAYAELGDSDAVRLGDTAIAMGNPFNLSEDHTPAVTLGIITGLHRYQKGTRGNLIYTDCIQTDASINPGNSGGPLFNAAGKVIGINGRISINTRGRYNVGFGYAISMNQIRRFIPALRAGLLARHGGLLATVEAKGGAVVFDKISPSSPVSDIEVRIGDRLVSFDGVPVDSPNHFASLRGTYPEDWPITLAFERGDERWTRSVRLAPVEPRLRKPFETNWAANEREVHRLLRAFQVATLIGGDSASRPSGWKWSVTREGVVDLQTGEAGSACFVASQRGTGAVRMLRRDEKGAATTLLIYDDAVATWRATPGGDPVAVLDDARMVYAALYLLQTRLLAPIDEMELDSATHTGADRQGTGGPPLEVIDCTIEENVIARYSFDPATGLCVRVRVRDSSLQTAATIELTDHRDVGGMVWPCTIEVSGGGFEYRDVLSDWEPIP